MPRGLAASSMLAVFLPFVTLAPTPTPDLKVLGTILAGPPDSTWVEARPASDTLQGTFGATFYVDTEWSNQADRDAIRNELLADGFIGGYARTFETANSYITEDVKAFPDETHATTNYRWAEAYFHDPKDTANNVDLPTIPNSFGEKFLLDPWHGVDIYFAKGSYVFTVTVGGKTDYLTDVATAQAVSVYNFAPSHDVLQSSPGPNGSITPAAAIVGGGAVVVIVGVLAVSAILIGVARRRRPFSGGQAMLSPDGNYWWDGAQWQPVNRR